jgi:predicted nuclease of restriction endonuclease-like RecB superfamily
MMVKRLLKVKGRRRTFRANQGWHEIAGRKIFFRSDWEVKFAKYLQFLKENNHIKEWEHECHTFWFNEIKRGTRSYLPDFKITRPDGSHYWVEVKGYFDAKSLTKIKRFKKYYPQEQLRIADEKWFRENEKSLC